MAVASREIPADQFAAECRRWSAQIASGSFQPALVECKAIAMADMDQNFQGSHDAKGTAWPERRYEYPWPILIKTGHLRRSVTTDSEPGHVENIGPRDMATGTTVFYAGFHQYGTSKLPPRPFVEVSDKGVDAMEEAVATFVISTIFGG